jgi:ribosomal protein uL22
MSESKIEQRGEKIKEKFEEKAKEKAEAEQAKEAGAVVPEKKEEHKKPVTKKEIKKPIVTEARARTEFLPISFKESVEICRAIKGLPVKKAEDYLNDVIALKRPIHYKRYVRDVSHKRGKGFGPGRYPAKACSYIVKVLKNAAANAQYLNLNKEKLFVKIAKADRSMSKEKQGRYSTVEIIVAESTKPKEEKKKPAKKVSEKVKTTPKVSETVNE